MTWRGLPWLTALLIAAGASVPAMGVGLGPLSNEGVTRGPAKAFYLNIRNPYDQPRQFRIYSEDDSGLPLDRVEIRPGNLRMAANSRRRFLVIARDLAPGEDLSFRICAELDEPQRGTVHARVCSQLRARRIGDRPDPSDSFGIGD